MWDQLVLCYQLLGKKQAAQEIVMQRLRAAPDDPKLWCTLGDIQGCDEHYVKAWEVSGGRSARAQRSLARSAMTRKDNAAAADAFELALGLSPLYPDAWFALGYCCLRLGRTERALQVRLCEHAQLFVLIKCCCTLHHILHVVLVRPRRNARCFAVGATITPPQAFSAVTQQEPEHGEAWANLAALWLQRGGAREALHAAEQAVKMKRDSWQAWDNCATAAVRARAVPAAIRALSKVRGVQQGGGEPPPPPPRSPHPHPLCWLPPIRPCRMYGTVPHRNIAAACMRCVWHDNNGVTVCYF